MSLLPSNNSPLEHAIATLMDQLILGIDSAVIDQARQPETCAAKFLPWLAWQRSISDDEGWSFAETEASKRKLIGDYVQKHQRKGTPSVIRQLFRDLALGEVDIIENAANLKWNGTATFDGKYQFSGEEGDWAKYGIIVKRVVSNAQAQALTKILNAITPARCALLYIDFRSAELLWNGEISFDGSYNYGAVL